MDGEDKREISKIKNAVAEGTYRYAKHARDQLAERGIAASEVAEALISGEMIEHYPSHHYGESCMVLGRTLNWSLRETKRITPRPPAGPSSRP